MALRVLLPWQFHLYTVRYFDFHTDIILRHLRLQMAGKKRDGGVTMYSIDNTQEWETLLERKVDRSSRSSIQIVFSVCV